MASSMKWNLRLKVFCKVHLKLSQCLVSLDLQLIASASPPVEGWKEMRSGKIQLGVGFGMRHFKCTHSVIPHSPLFHFKYFYKLSFS